MSMKKKKSLKGSEQATCMLRIYLHTFWAVVLLLKAQKKIHKTKKILYTIHNTQYCTVFCYRYIRSVPGVKRFSRKESEGTSRFIHLVETKSSSYSKHNQNQLREWGFREKSTTLITRNWLMTVYISADSGAGSFGQSEIHMVDGRGLRCR